MILKGNSRGGAKDLALHLMKPENEHIEVLSLRGFASENLMGALNEVYAVSRGTRCKQFLYSLSLNPPMTERVTTEQFEAAIERAEEELGLSGQPRAIVIHEKEGRRHAHAVWSRIDTGSMKAVQMSYDHKKLNAVSRELYLEHGWPMPEGLADSSKRDPKNFTLEEWQQAKRVGKDARAIKIAFQDAWAISDSKAAFIHAMRERGYVVARGDRRGFVAVDIHGEVYAIPRYVGAKTKAVRQRLGDETALPSVSEAKQQIAEDMLPKVDNLQQQLETQNRKLRRAFDQRRKKLVNRQRAERQAFRSNIEARRNKEARQRQGRFRKGLGGIWDRLRGEHKRIRQLNEREAVSALVRDTKEHDLLVFQQLEQRRHLNIFKLEATRDIEGQRQELKSERALFQSMRLAKDDAPQSSRRSQRIRGPTPQR